jgi:NifU-like protein involved in Fe-S cluster formation
MQRPALSCGAQHLQPSALQRASPCEDENPRNVGSLKKEDPDVGTGLVRPRAAGGRAWQSRTIARHCACLLLQVGAPACGDVMKLQIKVDDSGKITGAHTHAAARRAQRAVADVRARAEAKFKTFGCGSAIVRRARS